MCYCLKVAVPLQLYLRNTKCDVMKKIALFSLILSFFFINASAQTTGEKSKKAVKKTVDKSRVKAPAKDASVETITLTTTSANKAYNNTANRLTIADPTINALKQNAAGGNVQISKSGIVGMPRGTYGFANGKILLRTTTATSSGAGYGSGAVATGSSINSLGTSESTIGVNGKSPYAGPWLWGSKLPVYNVPLRDSIRQ
jgi:hypothetical protein